MKTIGSLIFTAALVLFTVVGVHAQSKDTRTAVSREKLVLIKEYLALTGQDSVKMVNEMHDAQIAQANEMLSKRIDSDKTFTAAEKAAAKATAEGSFARFSGKFKEFIKTELHLDTMVEEIATPILDKNFSEAELRDLVAFSKSATGKKAVLMAPEMMAATFQYVSENVVPKLEDFMKKAVDEETAVIRKKIQTAPAKRKAAPKTL